MKRPNKYPYTRSQWEEMKIDFNYSDKIFLISIWKIDLMVN